MHHKKATQQAAFDMLKKLKNLDMSKVKGFSISVMLGDKDDDDEDYHTMPDGSKMEGKEHPKTDNLPEKEEEVEEEVEKDEDYEEKKKLRIR